MSSENEEGALCKVRDIALCQLLMVAGTTPVVGAGDLFYHGKTPVYRGKSHDSQIPNILFGPYKTTSEKYVPVAHCAVPTCLNYVHVIFIKHKTKDHCIIKHFFSITTT